MREGLDHVAGADDPGGDAVDGGVEVVEAEVDVGVELAAADELFGDGDEFVVEGDDVVAVPADRAGDVEQEAGAEHEDGADLLGDHLGGVVVRPEASRVRSFWRETA